MTNESTEHLSRQRVAVVIPCFKVTRHIQQVILDIPSIVWRIYVIDDACPDRSGHFVRSNVYDERVRVIFHEKNEGVGGAVITGYKAAVCDGADVIIKLDGDGQMDGGLIPYLINPVLLGEADYAKGNRFFDLEKVRNMPSERIFGNAVLSFMTKFSSGYWDLFDPTNGYTAIHANVARRLPYEKISRRYFFETDMLFRLNTLRAVVVDIPMDASYNDETSNLKISQIILEFIFKHIRNWIKRIFYNYYLRGLSIASIELPLGACLLLFGTVFGIWNWIDGTRHGVATSAGTVMLCALPILMGVQLILAFLAYDIGAVPTRPIQQQIKNLLK